LRFEVPNSKIQNQPPVIARRPEVCGQRSNPMEHSDCSSLVLSRLLHHANGVIRNDYAFSSLLPYLDTVTRDCFVPLVLAMTTAPHRRVTVSPPPRVCPFAPPIPRYLDTPIHPRRLMSLRGDWRPKQSQLAEIASSSF